MYEYVVLFEGLALGFNKLISKLSLFKSAGDLPPAIRCFFKSK